MIQEEGRHFKISLVILSGSGALIPITKCFDALSNFQLGYYIYHRSSHSLNEVVVVGDQLLNFPYSPELLWESEGGFACERCLK